MRYKIGNPRKPTRRDVEIDSWVERDRASITITDKRNNKTIAEWWDNDVQEMFDAGWFKPGFIRHETITGRDFKDSVLEYAEYMGLLAKSNPNGRNSDMRYRIGNPETVNPTYYQEMIAKYGVPFDPKKVKSSGGFRYGDRVVMDSDAESRQSGVIRGATGTVDAIRGFKGISVSPDPLGKMIFVKWDKYGQRSVWKGTIKKIKNNPIIDDRLWDSYWLRNDKFIIPNYDPNDLTPYPGNLKPGYYTRRQTHRLIKKHYNHPDVLQFIRDMMEI